MKSKINGKAFVIGRIVHYVSYSGSQVPFLLTRCYSDGEVHKADGVVFGDGVDHAAEFRGFVPYDESRKVGTWHFPSMGRKEKKPEPGKPLRDLTVREK